MAKKNPCKVMREMTNSITINYDTFIDDGAGGHRKVPASVKDAAAAIYEISRINKNLLQREVNADVYEFWVWYDENILDRQDMNVEWNGNQYDVIEGPHYDRNMTPELISFAAERVVK